MLVTLFSSVKQRITVYKISITRAQRLLAYPATCTVITMPQNINAPVKPSKIEGPTTRLTFLGILIDTSTMTASITDDCKKDLVSSLQSLLQQSKCTKHQLLSLIGKLSFACKVIPAGRIFLCRLINTSCSVSCPHHHIRPTKEAHLDMYRWLNFLPNGMVPAARPEPIMPA